MCCFNREVAGVHQTKIFVSPTKNGRQVTVYDNMVSGGGRLVVKAANAPQYDNAMILPCPLKSGADVTLLDLSNDSFSFQRLHLFFPQEEDKEAKSNSRGMRQAVESSHLEVHVVGGYLVSIAKTVDDLKRVDPKVFQVSDTIDQLFRKVYATGFGFVICCFDPAAGVKGHPIGYVHDLLPDGSLFVPCRHEHGHGTKETEKFSHEIYSLNATGKEAGSTRAELGYSGADTTKKVFDSTPKQLAPFVPRAPRDAQGGGIITTDVKCAGCSFFGGISGFCSQCWKKLSAEEQAQHTAEQKPKQVEREKAAWEKAQKEQAHHVPKPASEAEALQSAALAPFYPEIKCLRQRIINGEYKNDDLVFAQA